VNAARQPAKKPRAAVVIEQLDAARARAEAVVLITGPETFLAERASLAIRDQLRQADPDVEIHDVEADSYTSGELFTLASPSLFGEPRLILVTGVEKCSDAFLADSLKYLEAPSEGATLVVRHAGGNRAKALLDAIRSGAGGGIEIQCAEVKKEGDRIAFARSEFRKLGAQASPQAVRELCAAVSGDLAELSAACQQLVADTGSQVTEESVLRYYGGRVEAGAFKIADLALAGNTAQALVLLRHAVTNGDEPIPLLAAINSKLRGIARVYGASGSAAQLASSLGMAPWQVERALSDARRWREKDLARCIELAADTEWQLKGGSRDPIFALERLVTRISRHGKAQ
jgi:DNA polymerase-3 subunit delta